MSDSEKDASKWIEQLGLLTHPEGGYFREVYRSEEGIAQRALPARYGSGRNFGTSIYYMLKGNDFSAFHKLHSDEIWHFYEGCTVRIFLLTEDGSCKKLLLGRNVEVGEQLQVLLPHDLWFAAEIQMFGRSYGGGATRDLALRMRAGQQLVFGEQLGWLAPTVVREKGNAEFFRQVVHLRRQLTPYFSAGEMARPPKLAGSVPTVRADWQWGGVDWVTTDAVLTGAWHQPHAQRLALVFVNVSTNPVAAQVNYDLRPYGLGGATVRLTTLSPEGPGSSSTTPATLGRETIFPSLSAVAWEVQR